VDEAGCMQVDERYGIHDLSRDTVAIKMDAGVLLLSLGSSRLKVDFKTLSNAQTWNRRSMAVRSTRTLTLP